MNNAIRVTALVSLVLSTGMVLIGASSAMAEETALCKINKDPCPEKNLVTEEHWTLTPGGVFLALGPPFDPPVLCLGHLVRGQVLGRGNPQVIHATEDVLTQCGTNQAHNNCTVTAPVPTVYHLFRTGPNMGTLTPVSGNYRINCNTFLKPDCEYELAEKTIPIEGGSSGGMITISKLPLIFVKGNAGCTEEEVFLTELLQAKEAFYIVS